MTSLDALQVPHSTVGLRHVLATGLHLPDRRPKATSLNGQSEASQKIWVAADGIEAGVWDCDRGEFRSERPHHAEICQILAGRGSIHGDDGTSAQLEPGSLLVLPIGWRGTWVITETMRKTYVVLPGIHEQGHDTD